MNAYGFLNCNKPRGMTSRDLVNIVHGRLKSCGAPRRIKVGHCGTLDPLADGVLVIGVGPAVRLVPMVQEQKKHYRGVFRLGESSPSGDLEIEPTRHEAVPEPNEHQLLKTAEQFVGEIEQVPPVYSAVKIGGRRAYDFVRSGEDVEVPSRRVRIDRLEIIRYEYPDLELDIVCGSGTYIRSLGIDLAAAVGTVAVMTSLTREGVGPFEIQNAVTVDEIRNGTPSDWMLPASLGVTHLPKLVVNDTDVGRLGNGLCVDGDPILNGEPAFDAKVVAAMTNSNQLRALLKRKRGQWCPYRVFPIEDD